MTAAVARIDPPKRSLLGALAERYGMEPKAFEMTIRATVMPAPHSDEEFAACCLVAHEHKLNPITKEIYFMRSKGGGIQPIVGVDGWVKKCNEHPAFNGMDFEDIQDPKGALHAIKCIIYRKDRDHQIIVTEYLSECKRETPVWKQMQARMLRHRALIQCARIAFGFAGLMDPDEFEQWQDLYRGDTPRDITKAVVELPDIPDPPKADILPDAEAAKRLDAQGDQPDEEPDMDEPLVDAAGFKSRLEEALAGCRDEASIKEVWESDRDNIEKRLSRSDRAICEDLYDKAMARVAKKAKRQAAE